MKALDTGDRAPGYFVYASCPLCNGDLHHVASGAPGIDTQALAECRPCRRLWKFHLTMLDVTAEVPRPAAERKRRHRERQRAGAAA